MMSTADRLVYMANQIARNFATRGEQGAAAATADHIASFWDPRMKTMIFARADEPGHGLSASALVAVASLRGGGAPAPQTRATTFNAGDEAGHSDAG